MSNQRREDQSQPEANMISTWTITSSKAVQVQTVSQLVSYTKINRTKAKLPWATAWKGGNEELWIEMLPNWRSLSTQKRLVILCISGIIQWDLNNYPKQFKARWGNWPNFADGSTENDHVSDLGVGRKSHRRQITKHRMMPGMIGTVSSTISRRGITEK
jgi:hypothetical protein